MCMHGIFLVVSALKCQVYEECMKVDLGKERMYFVGIDGVNNMIAN